MCRKASPEAGRFIIGFIIETARDTDYVIIPLIIHSFYNEQTERIHFFSTSPL
jgi:hypothetical protein